MSIATLVAGEAPRPRLWFLAIVLIAWNAYATCRLTLPLRSGHEAFIARQIGRTGRNHLVLGLGVTKGANVAMVRSDGSLDIHRSYSPLASWTVALPMALGVDFDLAVRLPMLVSSNLFLIGLWGFTMARWGTHPAELALLFGLLSPVFVFSYGLTCIFEILALGPLMIALALFAQGRRNGWIIALIALMSIASAMYSWICWVALVPAMVREWRIGHRKSAFGLALVILGVPIAIHFLLTGLASGHPLEDLKIFIDHIAERSASRTNVSTSSITYQAIVTLGVKRWLRGIGLIPLAFTLGCLAAVTLRRRVPGSGWLIALFALGLPLNLARNIAFFHDFFIILFVPVGAVCAGVGTWWLATRLTGENRRALAIVVILGAFLAHDFLPRLRTLRTLPQDYQQATIARMLGEVVEKNDFVIVNPAICGFDPAVVALLSDPQREQSPRPFYCGQLSQTVFVASDTADAERISRWANSGQRVVVVEVGNARFELPPSFAIRLTPSAEVPLMVGVRGSNTSLSARRPDDEERLRRR
jgi:hypothetical protein